MQHVADPLQSEPTMDFARTGPDTLTGKYLRNFWTAVAMLDDVKPGRARPIQIMNEWFTYYRGATGVPHLVGFRCAHRGTQMSTGWVEGDCIRCFYHGWKYDADGQCVEQPAEHEGFAQKVRIPSYPTVEWHGVIFAYLGEGEAPPFKLFDGFEQTGYIESKSYTRRANYFNQRENACDVVHGYFVHGRSDFTRIGFNREIPRIEAEETDYGIRGLAKFSDGKAYVSHGILPLCSYGSVYTEETGWMGNLAWRVPIDDEHLRSFNFNNIRKTGKELEEYLAAKQKPKPDETAWQPVDEAVDAILRGDMHVDDVPLDHPGLINIQDGVSINAQPLISERADRLGRSDNYIILMRKIMAREVSACAAGRPIKRWRWDAIPPAETGM